MEQHSTPQSGLPLPVESLESLLEAFRFGESIHQLRKQYRLTPSRIMQILRGRELLPEELDDIVERYRQGECPEQIAAALALYVYRVRETLKRRLDAAPPLLPLNLPPLVEQAAPSVQKRRRGQIGRKMKDEHLKRGEVVKCTACGWLPPERFYTIVTVHHVVPVACGGSHDEQNLVLLCPNCHAIAHAMFPMLGKRNFGPSTKAELIAAIRDPQAYYMACEVEILRLLR